MTRTVPVSKKEVEAVYLERFRTLLSSFPEGRIEPSEEPDFLIWRPSSVLGIELMELHRETPVGTSPQQAREAMHRRVIERAQELYVAGGHPAARVTVFMHEGRHIERAEVDRLARDICGLAIRNLPGPNSTGEEFYEWIKRAYFPDAVNNVRVYRLDAQMETHFNCPGATWVASLSRTDIERALAAKAPKYPAYRKSCDEAWLIINADLRAMSTWFQFDSEGILGFFETNFERVFVLRHFGNKLSELAVHRP